MESSYKEIQCLLMGACWEGLEGSAELSQHWRWLGQPTTPEGNFPARGVLELHVRLDP